MDECDRESPEKEKDHQHPSIDRIFIEGSPSFKGVKCEAGMKIVTIDYYGTVRRCHSEPFVLGNIFEGHLKLFKKAVLCKSDICTCPYFGFGFAKGNPDFAKKKV